MIVYIIILILLVYACYKEAQALGCDGSCKDCDNANGKAVAGTASSEADTNAEIYAKINKAASFTDRFVTWRIGYIVGFAIALLVIFLLYQTLPTELEFVVIILVAGALIYFTFNFYTFHLIKCIEKNIKDSVNLLSNRDPNPESLSHLPIYRG